MLSAKLHVLNAVRKSEDENVHKIIMLELQYSHTEMVSLSMQNNSVVLV